MITIFISSVAASYERRIKMPRSGGFSAVGGMLLRQTRRRLDSAVIDHCYSSATELRDQDNWEFTSRRRNFLRQLVGFDKNLEMFRTPCDCGLDDSAHASEEAMAYPRQQLRLYGVATAR
jgi:hypothetical protein